MPIAPKDIDFDEMTKEVTTLTMKYKLTHFLSEVGQIGLDPLSKTPASESRLKMYMTSYEQFLSRVSTSSGPYNLETFKVLENVKNFALHKYVTSQIVDPTTKKKCEIHDYYATLPKGICTTDYKSDYLSYVQMKLVKSSAPVASENEPTLGPSSFPTEKDASGADHSTRRAKRKLFDSDSGSDSDQKEGRAKVMKILDPRQRRQ
jgi:hypothetical protein